MKLLTIIFVIVILSNLSFGFIIKGIFYELGKAVFDDKLKSFLERLKPMLQTGNSTLEIPVLDPFSTKYQKINFSEDNVRIIGDLRDIKLDGLSDYNVNEAKFQLAELKITLNVTWSSIKLKCIYSLNAKLNDWEGFSIFGDGDVWIRATNFTFVATAELSFNSNKVFVKELSTGLSLKAIKFTASGIYHNEAASESINAIVSSSLPHVLEAFQWLIVEEINVRLKNVSNSYLRDLTLQDIISIIG